MNKPESVLTEQDLQGAVQVAKQEGRGVITPSILAEHIEQAVLAKLAERAEPVYIVATGVVYEGQETYTRHDARPPLCDAETLYTHPPTTVALVEAAEEYMVAQNDYAKAEMTATVARENYTNCATELRVLGDAAARVSVATKKLCAAIEAHKGKV